MNRRLPEKHPGVRACLASESGFAVPIVLLSILIAFALGTVTVVASVNTQSSTVRDERAKQALAAAEAGVQQALLRYNRIRTGAPNVCVAGTTTMTVQPVNQTDGWCDPVPGSVTGNPSASFSYRVCPRGTDQAVPCPSPMTAHNIAAGEPASAIEIVSTGTVDGVSRRVEVVARSSGGNRPFAGNAGVIGLDSITAEGDIQANVATNGDISLDHPGAELTCDSASVGPGREIDPPDQASCAATQQSTSLPSVIQGDVRTNNANHRWYTPPSGPWFPEDPMTPSCTTSCWSPNAAPTSPAYKHLTIASGADRTLTLGRVPGGSKYSVCKLTLDSNSGLYAQNEPEDLQGEAPILIYFDAPEHCPGLTQTHGCYQQLVVRSNARIAATGTGTLALLFVGSDAMPTCATFSSNTDAGQACEQDFVAYGPRTHMSFASNSSFCGSIAGKSIDVASNSTLRASNTSSDFELPSSVASHYDVEAFVECAASPATTTTPNSGC